MKDDVKQLGLQALVKQGQVDKFLEYHLKNEEAGNKGQLIGSIARIADMVTQHSEGVMVEAVTERIVKSLSKLTEELAKSVQSDLQEVEQNLAQLTQEKNEEVRQGIARQIDKKLVEVERAINANSKELLRGFFDDLVPELRENARVTPQELRTMETNAVSVVKGELPRLIKSYFRDVMLTTDKISDFQDAVSALIPEPEKFDISKQEIRWEQIKNVPESVRRGGGGARALEWLIDVDLSTSPTNGQTLTYNAARQKWVPQTATGIGDLLAVNNLSDVSDPAAALANIGGIADVLDDTTPQLGGNLDLNGFTVGAASAADLTKLNALTATSTELNYVDGVTSAIQTQIDAKAPTASPSFTGTVTLPTGLTGVLRADSGVVSTDSDVTDLVTAASDTTAGKVELATATETSTGTDTGRAITPDGLAGSTIFGRKTVSVQVFDGTTAVTTGDGKAYITIPEALNGMNLVRAQATVVTAGTTNATTVMVHNKTDTQDMLSGAISIASGGTVGTVGTVNGSFDDVATNDVIRIDVDSVSTTAPQGLMVVLEFQLP